VFPKLVVCLDCGFTEFVVTDAELRVLRKTDGAFTGKTVDSHRSGCGRKLDCRHWDHDLRV